MHLKRIINLFETLFQDTVKIAKGNILLKMPIILVGNLVSNIFYAINTGMPVTEIYSAYRDSFRDVKAFLATHKDVETKKIELSALTQDYNLVQFKNKAELVKYNDDVKRLTNEIKRLEKEMSESDIKELFDLGMYQAVIEDVNLYKLGDTNKISDGMDTLLNRTPAVIKTPLQWAYLSKETAWYKVNQEILQLSDLVARDVMNRKQKFIEKQQADGNRDLPVEYRRQIGQMTPRRRILKGAERERFLQLAEKSRHANLLKAFVNYNLPNSKGEEYLNRIGVLMFTKYLKRIQNVITQSTIQHPIRSIIMLSATAMFMDIDKIQDQSLITKGLDDNDFGFLGILPVYNPLEHVMNVVTPAIVKPELYFN